MNPDRLEKIAFTVERFLNAARIPDGRDRTLVEERLTRTLADHEREAPYAVISQGSLFCYANKRLISSCRLPPAVSSSGPDKAIWCDGGRVSAIDADAYGRAGQLVMLGSLGLVFSMPGALAEDDAQESRGKKKETETSISSNNNNNNNNNNNG